MTIQLPSGASAKSYVESTSVTFKAKTGEYDYWNGTEAIRPKKMKGIVVGSGFQFVTTKIATKKKTVQYTSSDFGWDIMKDGQISIKELIRETGKDFTSNTYGKKTYSEWKEEGMRPAKIIYLLSVDDDKTIYKLIFSGRAFMEVSKFITLDIPNFIVEFGVSDTAEETDNGDFYSPTFSKLGAINAADSSIITNYIEEIDTIINRKGTVQRSINTNNNVSFDTNIDDIAF